MKLLFISRAYPPVIGGLEEHNYQLHKALQKKTHTESIINKNGKKALPFFLPFCALKALITLSQYDAIILGDGVMALIGWLIKLFKPNSHVICVVHGLDITYSNALYQRLWIKIFLPKVDKLIAVSDATANVAIQRGINKAKVKVIPNGISPQTDHLAYNRKTLENLIKISCQDKIILLTIGRLVKRKGVHWFVKHVMPNLGHQFIYIIAGDGPEKEKIISEVKENNLQNKVFCLGFVNNDMKSMLYSNADLFIQPNVKVDGDMEGFGIAVLEANQHGLAVIGSDIEGLKDSITHGQNGWLIESENTLDYIEVINTVTKSNCELKQAGEKAKEYTINKYCWNNIADQYIAVLHRLQVEKNDNKR